MENPRRNPKESIDELGMAKAAAWAWYQRGSGSEGTPMSEYHFATTHQPPKPSRYKSEAMKTAQQQQAMEEKSESPSPLLSSPHRRTDNHNHNNSDLLDRYEIERISKQLDYYIEIEASNVKQNPGFRAGGRRVVSLPEESETSGMMKKKNKKKSNRSKGFWLRHGVVTCGGSRDDVVEFARGFRPRMPEKLVEVVGVANSRPRNTHA